MNFDFSDRVDRVGPNATLAISDLTNELEAQDEDIVDLSVGAPDFLTPDNITQAAKDALNVGHIGYTSSNKIPELKEAIAAKLRGSGIDAEADEVIATPGGRQALFETFQTLVNDGDEVVLLDPMWASYETVVKLTGGMLSRVSLMQHDFRLEPALDELADTVSDETRLLVVNSLSNPTGGVFSNAALKGARDFAIEHDVAVISDEIHERIVYGGFEHTSLGSPNGMENRTITINGFSKAFSMTDWRLGYLHAPSDLIMRAGKLHSHLVSCAMSFVQHTGVEALSERTDNNVEKMRQAFEDRRNMLVDLLAKRGVDVAVPKGAFYMILPVDDDNQAWRRGTVQNAKVATVPGGASNAPGCARISYAASEECLREAVERFAKHDYI